MSQEQIKVTLSKKMYWDEVIKRADISILDRELYDEVRRLGAPKILFILADYAERNRSQTD